MANGHGGKREGSGAKPKWKEEDVVNDLKNALKKLYHTNDDKDAINRLVADVASTDNGRLWILRRLLGDPRKALEVGGPNGEAPQTNSVVTFIDGSKSN